MQDVCISSEIWNQSFCKITRRNQSLATLLNTLLIINFFAYLISRHSYIRISGTNSNAFFKYSIHKDITKSSKKKGCLFWRKKMFNVLLNVLKFPPPENLLTPRKRHIWLKKFSSVCSFAEELGITAAVNKRFLQLDFSISGK